MISAAQPEDKLKDFTELITKHKILTIRRLYTLFKSMEDSEDCLQEANIVTWAKWESFEGRNGAARSTWYLAIVHNLALHYLRKRKVRHYFDHVPITQYMPLEEVAKSPLELILEKERNAVLDVAVSKLPPSMLQGFIKWFISKGLSNTDRIQKYRAFIFIKTYTERHYK